MTPADDLLDAARRMAATIRPGDMDSTLSSITAAAVEVLPDVQASSLTVKHSDGRVETRAPTHDVLLKVDAAQYEFREGPCYEAATDSVHVTSPDMATDPRFPRYGPVAVRAGFRAQAGIRLFDTPTAGGALNLYSTKVGTFEDLGLLTQLFAHHAAVALDYARKVDQLEEAVKSRQVIGQAVGIVMERYQLDEARAFGFLARLSSHENLKLRVVAARLIEAGPPGSSEPDQEAP